MRPIGARVIVKLLPPEDVTSSGLVIPDVAKKKSLIGEVVGVGNGYRVAADDTATVWSGLDVIEGDRVLIGDYVGEEIILGGEKHMVLHEEHILGVFE